MPVTSGGKGWVTSLAAMPALQPTPPAHTRAANGRGAPVAHSDGGGGREVYDGRPCVAVGLDDGRMVLLSLQTGSCRSLFARPFLFWDACWLPSSSRLLLASSEGSILEMLLDDDTLMRGLSLLEAHMLMAIRLLPPAPATTAQPLPEHKAEVRTVRPGGLVRVARQERQERGAGGGVGAKESGGDSRSFIHYVNRAHVGAAGGAGSKGSGKHVGEGKQGTEGEGSGSGGPVWRLPPVQGALHRVVATPVRLGRASGNANTSTSSSSKPAVGALVVAAGRAGLVLCKIAR